MGVKLEMFAVEENPRVCQAGETVFQAFDMGAEMYVVLEGEVELTIGSRVVETLGPGEPFGEMALIHQAPRTATAIAKTPCQLAVLTDRPFLFLVQTTPHLALPTMDVKADSRPEM